MIKMFICRITFNGKEFYGEGNCKEVAEQRAIDKFHSFFGCPTWEQTNEMKYEYV